jgi:hypothetical protein
MTGNCQSLQQKLPFLELVGRLVRDNVFLNCESSTFSQWSPGIDSFHKSFNHLFGRIETKMIQRSLDENDCYGGR